MIFVYRVISIIIFPILVIFIYFRKFINKEDPVRYKEKIFLSSFINNFSDKRKLIWFHVASVGELQSIIPIIQSLNNNEEKYNFLITSITLSSGKLLKKELGEIDNLTHRYLPLDINCLVKAFVEIWQPHAVFFVDSEIWPNLILNLKEKNIPIAILNGRLTLKSFSRWSIIKNTAQKIFGKFDLILVANSISKKYFYELGGKNIYELGNIKFSDKVSKNKSNNPILKHKKYWCILSTHNNEEELCIKVHLKLSKKIKDFLTIIIPRHINRSEEIKKFCIKNDLKVQVVEKDSEILQESEIVIVNAFGVMSDYLSNAKSVFIGKSLLKKFKNDGGQNPILAALHGCKIYHGPYVFNFKDIYEFLGSKEICKEIVDVDELIYNLNSDFKINEKNVTNSKKLINDIGEEILFNTLNKINSFISNEYK